MSAHFESSSVVSKELGEIVSDGAQGLLILTGVSVVVAIGAHRALRSFVIACAVAAVTSTILFNVASSVHSGFVDPFWPIAVVTGGGVAFAISALVGTVLREWLRRHASAGAEEASADHAGENRRSK